MEKLQHTYDEWEAEVEEALEVDGEYSRRYGNAIYLFSVAQRQLEVAQAAMKRREDDEKRTAKEIVDDLMRR
nr:hypothetical protein [Actinomycetota bacterium]